MEIICTQDPAALRPRYPAMRRGYKDAFAREPWRESRKCARPNLPNRSSCVGQFSAQAIGELCVDCGLRPTEPAYSDEELDAMFDDLIARSASFYMESDERGLLMATIGVAETAGELAATKYADSAVMQEWLVATLGGEEVPTTYLTESFANLALRPRENMKNRGESVRSIVEQTGSRLVTTRTISPAVVAATLRDFPEARLYLPDGANRSDWNAGLDTFTDRAVGVVPDRRAFLMWSVV